MCGSRLYGAAQRFDQLGAARVDHLGGGEDSPYRSEDRVSLGHTLKETSGPVHQDDDVGQAHKIGYGLDLVLGGALDAGVAAHESAGRLKRAAMEPCRAARIAHAAGEVHGAHVATRELEVEHS